MDGVRSGSEIRNIDGITDSNINSLSFTYAQLPQTEVELDNLTEFNTAHNRRITSLVDTSTTKAVARKLHKRPSVYVHFNDADEIINPEDVDPSIGRFRNLIQETFIPHKRAKGNHEGAILGVAAPVNNSDFNRIITPNSNNSNNSLQHSNTSSGGSMMNMTNIFGPSYSLAAKLGLPLPNLAPNVESEFEEPTLPHSIAMLHAFANSKPENKHVGVSRSSASDILNRMESDVSKGLEMGLDTGLVDSNLPKKKKYAKEAWPGKRPGFLVGPTA